MTAGHIPSDPRIGPCAEPCKHIDCAACRSIAATDCVYCGKPIGYDTAFYRETNTKPFNYSHAVCAEEAAEAQ